MITPFMLLLMAIMDIVFLMNSCILQPAVAILSCLLCYKVDLSCLSNAVDNSYEVLF